MISIIITCVLQEIQLCKKYNQSTTYIKFPGPITNELLSSVRDEVLKKENVEILWNSSNNEMCIKILGVNFIPYVKGNNKNYYFDVNEMKKCQWVSGNESSYRSLDENDENIKKPKEFKPRQNPNKRRENK